MALAELGDWTELDRFAKSKKSPIGYEVPIVDFFSRFISTFHLWL